MSSALAIKFMWMTSRLKPMPEGLRLALKLWDSKVPNLTRRRDKMPFPDTIDALIAAGYKFEDHGHCRGCGAAIEWYVTPKGKMMPMDVDPDGNCESHFGTCPEAKKFRKEN